MRFRIRECPLIQYEFLFGDLGRLLRAADALLPMRTVTGPWTGDTIVMAQGLAWMEIDLQAAVSRALPSRYCKR